jgi:tetratricopeptide (TPR) repeat protein
MKRRQGTTNGLTPQPVSEDPESLVTELLREPGPRRQERIATEPRLRLLKVCDLLQSRSRELWFEDPAGAVETAELAVSVAESLEEARYGRGLVADARALAWAHLGNAHRIASDVWKADEALRAAEAHHVVTGEDPLVRAEILSFQASLRDLQSRPLESIHLLDRARAIYRAAGERHREGRAMVQKGMVLSGMGALKEALAITRRSLPKLDLWREPPVVLVARHNLTRLLADQGAYPEALEALRRTRRLNQGLGEPTLHLLRLRWLEGHIAGQLGRLEEAAAILRQVRWAFTERKLGLDVAAVSLDLALAEARLGRRAEARQLVLEAIPLFESRGMMQDVLAALLLYKDVAF